MDLSHLETDPVTAVDPNAMLARVRAACQQTMTDLDDPELAGDVPANEAEIATAFLQLDDWIARGGFLPSSWQDTTE